jgi:hypothetical protein
MAPTSKYAFGPNGEEFRCAHPDNTPICQALLNKAAAYPPEKKYNRDATMRAAQKCSELTYSLSSLTWGHWAWSYPPMARTQFGANICRFIQSVIENPPPVKCRNADNQPIYQALVGEGRELPPCREVGSPGVRDGCSGPGRGARVPEGELLRGLWDSWGGFQHAALHHGDSTAHLLSHGLP